MTTQKKKLHSITKSLLPVDYSLNFTTGNVNPEQVDVVLNTFQLPTEVIIVKDKIVTNIAAYQDANSNTPILSILLCDVSLGVLKLAHP